jgi:hypothetical protein
VQSAYDLFRTHESAPSEAEWLGSGNLVVSRSAFAAAGGFDETLEACEDVDFCARLREAGYRIINDPALVSRHFGDPASLRALFVSELWRGRDNLRVTMRPPVSPRSIASLAVPLLTLVGLSIAILGLAIGQPVVALLGLAVVIAFIVLRAAILASRATPSLSLLGQAVVVAAVYNLGRALALVWRAKHRRARGTNRVAAMGAVR